MTNTSLFTRQAIAAAVLLAFSSVPYAAEVSLSEFSEDHIVSGESVTFTAPEVTFKGTFEAQTNTTFQGNFISSAPLGDQNQEVTNGQDSAMHVIGNFTATGNVINLGTLIVNKNFTAESLASKGYVTVVGKTTIKGDSGAHESPDSFDHHSSNTSIGSFTTGEFEYGGQFTTYGTMTVQSGKIVCSEIEESNFAVHGNLYLNAKDAVIQAQGLSLDASTVAVGENESFDSLTVIGTLHTAGQLSTIKGDVSTIGTNLNGALKVEGVLSDAPAGGNDSWIGAAVEVVGFRSTATIKVGTVAGASLTAESVYTPNQLRLSMTDAYIDVKEKIDAGSIFNVGSIKAENAVVELTGDGSVDGYAFVNGNDYYMTEAKKADAEATIGTLIVKGNALNIATDAGTSTLNVQNFKADRLDNQSVVNATGGTVELQSIDGALGTINLEDATLKVETTSTFGSVAANRSTVHLVQGTYTFDSLEKGAEGVTVVLDDLTAQAVNLGTVSGTGLLTRAASGKANDSMESEAAAAVALIDAFMDGAIKTDDYVVRTGIVSDGLAFNVTDSGDMTGIEKLRNPFVESLSFASTLSASSWRHEIHSLNQRMGQLRDTPDGVGAWARVYGSELEYGTKSASTENITLQVGSDISTGDWKFGVAAHYTDGESDYHNGSAEIKNYGFALYGVWLAPGGSYLDLVAKYSRLDNDFTLDSHKGSYNNNAFSVSAEVGHKFKFADDRIFVEPQIEVAYGYMTSADYTTDDGIRVDQENFRSLIGRVGVRTGYMLPNNKGSVYARVSGNYDFKGEMNARYYGGGRMNSSFEDIGGSWVEYGIGASYNWTDNTYTFIDLERSSGGEVKENYRWNIGLRHVF